MGSNARYHLWDVYFHLVYPHRAEVNYQPERIMPALKATCGCLL